MPRHSDGVVLSNWHTLFEDFSTSTQDFYAAVEAAIADRNLPDIKLSRVFFSEGGIGSAKREYLRIERQRIVFDICSAPYGKGHFFSWWLAKIPAKYGLFIVLGIALGCLPLCLIFLGILLKIFEGSLFGMVVLPFISLLVIPAIFLLLGLGVERGLIGDEEWVLSIPWVGYLYYVVFNPVSYYRLDTAMMFRDSIRSAVNEVLNDLREEKGLRLLGDEELRPDADEGEATA
ncbi:MAG: hypothetical protein ABIS20_01295 [Thermoanaerobaculia bacterium]